MGESKLLLLRVAAQADVPALVRLINGFLAVDPARRGQKLGHRLIRGVEEYSRERQCTAVELDVFNIREELPPFYRSAGFVEVGTGPFEHPDLLLRPAHLIRMRKEVSPALQAP
jgi:ribosomal protein S18 acetylase RimI-like enzyme